MILTAQNLIFRTIDPLRDGQLAAAHQLDACICSFGDDSQFQGSVRYLKWLEAKVEEFPEGFLIAFLGNECVGQIELEVPYGLRTGYANLVYVTPAFRGLGFAQMLHERSVRYFKSWEADRIELHCSPTNERAMRFYRKLGYRRTGSRQGGVLWKMALNI
jgi:ribosomal protein S18 acetylase RimI-like enzyme